MKFNHAKFLEACGNLNDHQRQGIDFLLSSLEADEAMTDIRWIAYCLATVDRECAGTWQPIREYTKGAGRPYGDPDPTTGHAYYGRGYVQITWAANYKSLGRAIGVDLYNNPDLALVPETAYKIMSYGMTHGAFTGASLSTWINSEKCDYVNARRIINGVDHAQGIAKAAQWFEATLTACLEESA